MEEKKEVVTEETLGGERMVEKKSVEETPSEKQETTEAKSMFETWNWIYYLLGIVEIFLVFRFAFKLLGANPTGGFVSFIYSVTDFLLAPFFGIFHAGSTTGVETTSVLEPATIIAMIVYGVIGWGIAKILEIKLASK